MRRTSLSKINQREIGQGGGVNGIPPSKWDDSVCLI